ncbi:MAG: ribosome assembly factor SBDS [Promethearchaeota archaeon]
MSQRGDIHGDKRIDLGKFVIARLTDGKHEFEILVDPKKAWDFKKKIAALQKKRAEKNEDTRVTPEEVLEEHLLDVQDVVESPFVFKNLKRGEKPAEGALREYFDTEDFSHICSRILLDGEIQLTKTQRDEIVAKKRNKILNILARNCINPKDKLPHPPARILKAMEEAKVKIDPLKSAEDQVKSILREIQAVIPIKMETVEMAVKIPASFAAKGYNLVSKFGQIKRDEWQTNGSWIGVVDLPAGLRAEFLDRVNKLTHGRVQTKVLKKIS